MIELNKINKYREFEDLIKKYLGDQHLNIQKSWEIGNQEPKDPEDFIDILELFCPDMTFLQFKRLELYNFWDYNTSISYHVNKKLNLRSLFNALKEIFPEDL